MKEHPTCTCTLAEVQRQTKIPVSELLNMGSKGSLGLYVFAEGWLLNFYGVDVSPSPMGNKRKRVVKISMTPERVTGPVRLYGEAVARFKSNPNHRVSRFVANPPGDLDHDHDAYEYQLCAQSNIDEDKTSIRLADTDLMILADDLEQLKLQNSHNLTCGDSIEKPVDTKERKTLHLIIAALASMSNTNISTPSKSAASIESQIALLGGQRRARAIENHLNAVAATLYELKNLKPP